MTKHGKHEDRGPIAARRRWYFEPEEEKPSRWRRKWAGVPVVGWLLGGGALTAVALFVAIVITSGSVSTSSIDVIANAGSMDSTATRGICTLTLVNAGDTTAAEAEYDIQWDGGVAGDVCTLTFAVHAGTSDVDVVLEGWTPPTGVTNGELTGTLGTDCGLLLPAGSTTQANPTLDLAITDQADPGATYDLAGAQLKFVPAGTEDLSSCT